MIDVLKNHRELMTDSNSMSDLAIRFYKAWLRGQMSDQIKGTRLVLLFRQYLVVLAQSSAENYTRRAFKTMNPFLSF